MQNDTLLERIRFSLDVYFLSQEYKKHCLNKEMLYDDIDKITARLSKEEGIHLYKDISIIENNNTTIVNCSLPLLGNFMYDAYDLNRGVVTIHKLYTAICIKFIYKSDESSDDTSSLFGCLALNDVKDTDKSMYEAYSQKIDNIKNFEDILCQ
jgi:hypothetical protein